MPSPGALKAGKAIIELSLLTGPVEKQLKTLQSKLKGFGDKLSSIGKVGMAAGGAILAAFAGATKMFTDVGAGLDDMSARTGVTVESLSALEYAANQSGASLQAVEKATMGMAKQLLAAQNGSTGAISNLAQLGLTIEQLRNMRPDEQFTLIADRLAAVSDPGQRAA